MRIPKITILNNPDLIRASSHLKSFGKLTQAGNNLIYLDVDDDYIHSLFPLLKDSQIKKPDYFTDGSAGAHVSVIYPEEQTPIIKKYLHKEYHFKIMDLVIAKINVKNYYVLLLDSPMLRQIRINHGLPEKLNFKNYSIDFHITIGVSYPE